METDLKPQPVQTSGDVADAALRESEERLRLAVDTAEIGFWDVDVVNDRLIWPARTKAMFGISPDVHVTMQDFYDGLHPDDREATAAAYAEAADPARRGLYDVEYRTVGKEDGLIRWVAAKGRGIFDEDGRCVRVIGTAIDLTERRRTETELQASEARIRDITTDLERQVEDRASERARLWQVSPDLLSVIDMATAKFDRINPAWTSTFGWSAAEMEGQPYERFVHPDDVSASVAAFEQVQTSNPVLRFENRYRTKGGDWHWLSWVAVPEEGKLYSTTRDVTQEKARESSLRLHEEIIQSDSAPICAFDQDYRLTAFNKARSDEFFRIYGYRVRPGDYFPGLFTEDQAPVIKAFMARALGGESFMVVEDFGDPDIVKPYWEISYSPIRDREGRIVGAFHHARDITQRLKAQADLAVAQEGMRQAQKMEAVGQLTGGVAHDFNNLLTVIRGSVDLLRRPGLSDEKRTRYVDAIGDTADRAAKLTSQLLSFSRRQTLKPETFDVTDSLDHVANIVRTLAGSRIELEVVRPQIPLFVTADKSQFDTAIVNMAVNARDAMLGEGRLTMRVGAVSNIPARRSHLSVVGDFVAVAITDTGSGIAPEEVSRVFEPFYTTKGVGHGTGLGLSQVIGFAKQSGGDILVESVVGEGSTFTLYLPREYALTDRSETVPLAKIDGHGICVLVVEDNEDVGDFATDALDELGYDSVLARSAQQALDELAKDRARFHIVFSDVVMPGLSGLELAEIIRREYPTIPIILTSGYSHVLAENGQHGYELLHKPYSVEQLSRVLRKAVAWHRIASGRG